jgi:hypothetical protein
VEPLGGIKATRIQGQDWALIKEAKSQLRLLPCENTGRRHYPEGHWACWHLDLGLPSSRTVRSKFLGFMRHSAYDIFVIAALTKTISAKDLYPEY